MRLRRKLTALDFVSVSFCLCLFVGVCLFVVFCVVGRCLLVDACWQVFVGRSLLVGACWQGLVGRSLLAGVC